MLKRIRDGLFDPKKVVDYIKDKMFMTILVLILFSLISLFPTIIKISKYSLDYDTKQTLISYFKDEYIPFEIKENKLVCYDANQTSNYEKEKGNFLVVGCVDNDLSKYEKVNKIVVAFCEDEVVIKTSSINLKKWKYSELEELNGLDLNDLALSNISSWDKVFRTINGIYDDYLGFIITIVIIAGIVSESLTFVFVAMLLSLGALFRLSRALKFSSIFKMNVYYLAPFVVATLLSNIFEVGFLYLIGLVITLIYSNIGQIEVWQRVYGHHTEG